jgi:hypothetical protein
MKIEPPSFRNANDAKPTARKISNLLRKKWGEHFMCKTTVKEYGCDAFDIYIPKKAKVSKSDIVSFLKPYFPGSNCVIRFHQYDPFELSAAEKQRRIDRTSSSHVFEVTIKYANAWQREVHSQMFDAFMKTFKNFVEVSNKNNSVSFHELD